jgi:tetratricopeptide (TPR) repeat protein
VIRLEKLDSNHPDVATSYNNLGGAYYFKKQYEKSLEYFKKALSIRQTKFGNNHPDTKNTLRWIEFVKKAMS